MKTDSPTLSPYLWEAMMENPPPVEDALCRDIYDQVNWVAQDQPMIAVSESLLWQLFDFPQRVNQLVYLVDRGKFGSLDKRRETEAHLKSQHGWFPTEIHLTMHKLRDYHLFQVEQTAMRYADTGNRIFKVPVTANARLTGKTEVAEYDRRSELESMAALAARYHTR